MMLKETGAISPTMTRDFDILKPDWHTRLTDKQLMAYIRYQFIRLKEHVIYLDSPAHTHRRPNWDGGENSAGVTYKALWPKAMNAIKEREAHPGVWVAARFSPIALSFDLAKRMSAPPIKPSSLADHNAATIYAEYCNRFTGSFTFNLNIALKVVASRLRELAAHPMPEKTRVFYVLCDEAHLSTPAFFRHGMAAAAECDKAALKYLWRAAVDYEAQQPLYDAACASQSVSDFITPELQQYVINIRKHWMTYND